MSNRFFGQHHFFFSTFVKGILEGLCIVKLLTLNFTPIFRVLKHGNYVINYLVWNGTQDNVIDHQYTKYSLSQRNMSINYHYNPVYQQKKKNNYQI